MRGLPANDFELRPGEGYFVRTGRGGTWIVEGHRFLEAPTLEVAAGWTLVGLPHNGMSYTAGDILDELDGSGTGAMHVARWQQGMWESKLRGVGDEGFQLEVSRGYFVRSDHYGTLTPGRPAGSLAELP